MPGMLGRFSEQDKKQKQILTAMFVERESKGNSVCEHGEKSVLHTAPSMTYLPYGQHDDLIMRVRMRTNESNNM